MEYFACPKCNRRLKRSGEITVTNAAGLTVGTPVFQCGECMMVVDFCGEAMEGPLTFAVDGSGRVFDPADPDGELRF